MKNPQLKIFACITCIVVLFSSCKKAIDIIEHYPNNICDFCKVEQVIAHHDGITDVVNVQYNSKGNPVKMLVNNEYYGNLTQTFRYDKQDRLQDYMLTFGKNKGVLLWHRYHYTDAETVIDSLWEYEGLLTDENPPPFDPDYTTVRTIKLDNYGRIIKTIFYYDKEKIVHNFQYNEAGNMEGKGIMYDNKVNVYRTNKVWQFVYNDYSMNNPVTFDYSGSVYPIDILYNFFGLPQKLKATGKSFDSPVFASILGLDYRSAEIKYSCDDIHNTADKQ